MGLDGRESEQPQEQHGLKIYFNPFAFSIEQNNEFLRLGYEPMLMRIPSDREMRQP